MRGGFTHIIIILVIVLVAISGGGLLLVKNNHSEQIKQEEQKRDIELEFSPSPETAASPEQVALSPKPSSKDSPKPSPKATIVPSVVPSPAASTPTVQNNKLNAPKDLYAVFYCTSSSGQIYVKWIDDSDNETGFKIQFKIYDDPFADTSSLPWNDLATLSSKSGKGSEFSYMFEVPKNNQSIRTIRVGSYNSESTSWTTDLSEGNTMAVVGKYECP